MKRTTYRKSGRGWGDLLSSCMKAHLISAIQLRRAKTYQDDVYEWTDEKGTEVLSEAHICSGVQKQLWTFYLPVSDKMMT